MYRWLATSNFLHFSEKKLPSQVFSPKWMQSETSAPKSKTIGRKRRKNSRREFVAVFWNGRLLCTWNRFSIECDKRHRSPEPLELKGERILKKDERAPSKPWITGRKYHKHRELCVEIFWSDFKAGVRTQLENSSTFSEADVRAAFWNRFGQSVTSAPKSKIAGRSSQ